MGKDRNNRNRNRNTEPEATPEPEAAATPETAPEPEATREEPAAPEGGHVSKGTLTRGAAGVENRAIVAAVRDFKRALKPDATMAELADGEAAATILGWSRQNTPAGPLVLVANSDGDDKAAFRRIRNAASGAGITINYSLSGRFFLIGTIE